MGGAMFYVDAVFFNSLKVLFLAAIAWTAYDIRLYAIKEYGNVIHEFDPWFNFRATQYLADNGWERFFKWFDYMSWYPLGRPVGTTIYPGMQITAVGIWKTLGWMGGDWAMSLNDICCFIPAWFGVSATAFLGLLTWEVTKSSTSSVFACAIMAVVPAHIMRSVGGGYDNESIALTAMVSTFYFWVRSLRDKDAWIYGVATGLCYIYMVAAWGGYIFVLNMIAFHAGVLVLTGRYSPKLHKAYTLFYVIGTFGAVQVPVVGWAPLKSLEQLLAFGVFAGLQLIEFCEFDRRKRQQGWDKKAYRLYTQVFGGAAALGFAMILILLPMGYFGPLSSRIRGLFVKHTRTGNPLVDSVAEHQPATSAAYYQYLHFSSYLSPIGFVLMFFDRSDAKLFLISYEMVAYFFSSKMMRLIILMGPITSALGGVGLAWVLGWATKQLTMPVQWLAEKGGFSLPSTEEDVVVENTESSNTKKGKKGKKQRADTPAPPKKTTMDRIVDPLVKSYFEWYEKPAVVYGRIAAAFFALLLGYSGALEFHSYSRMLAQSMSQPVIVYKGRTQSGQVLMVDDYREAYWFLRDKTPEDARVMAWWDYGYQITGIANRTTIADGNTWNHEHIATLARCLVSPEKEAHQMIRHLADYVLVWAGGGGDDLAKSPHLARIGNSVFPDICPRDPTCANFGFYSQGNPTPLMSKSLLYKLHSFGRPGVTVNPDRFQEVFTSKYGKVRIYKVKSVSKESKRWVADPANRVCDAPGSWYCSGQYPPALEKYFKKKGIVKEDFAQLEDFNNKKKNDDYQKSYHARMAGQPLTPEDEEAIKQQEREKKAQKKLAKEERKKKKAEKARRAALSPEERAAEDNAAEEAAKSKAEAEAKVKAEAAAAAALQAKKEAEEKAAAEAKAAEAKAAAEAEAAKAEEEAKVAAAAAAAKKAEEEAAANAQAPADEETEEEKKAKKAEKKRKKKEKKEKKAAKKAKKEAKAAKKAAKAAKKAAKKQAATDAA